MSAIVDDALGRVLCDIGQLSKSDRRALRLAAVEGKIEQWRGHWHPYPGAHFGIGPLKTCFGPIGSKAHFASFVGRPL